MAANDNRLDALDALKGMAALIIAYVYHYKNDFYNCTPIPQVLPGFLQKSVAFLYQYGYLTLSVFFFLSGYVMYAAYAGRIARGEVAFGVYLKRRLVRVMPLFWVTTLAAWMLEWYYIYRTDYAFVIGNNDLHHLFFHLFGLQYIAGVTEGQSFNGPGWFITAILVCYVLFYLLAKKTKQYLPMACLGFVLLGSYLVFRHPYLTTPFLDVSMGQSYLGFFLGVLTAWFLQQAARAKEKEWKLAAAGAVLLAVWLFAFFFGLLGNEQTTFIYFGCTGILLVALFAKPVRWLLSRKVLVWFGKISFSVYLWNFPVDLMFDLVNRRFMIFDFNSVAVWLLHLAVSLLVAAASWRWLEPWLAGRFARFLERYFPAADERVE